MTAFQSRTHAQFQARIWREYATVKRQWALNVMGKDRAACLSRMRAALAWLRANRDSDRNLKGGDA